VGDAIYVRALRKSVISTSLFFPLGPGFSMFNLLFSWLLATSTTNAGLIRRDGVPTIHVKNGSYEGIYSAEYDQDFFLGVPYAQPPINDLRFRIPQSLNSTWDGPRTAQAYPNEVRLN
jgi:hypothetical protein